METIGILFRDVRFWSALIILAQTLLFYFVPDFPKELWTQVLALVDIVVVVLLGISARGNVRSVRAARQRSDTS